MSRNTYAHLSQNIFISQVIGNYMFFDTTREIFLRELFLATISGLPRGDLVRIHRTKVVTRSFFSRTSANCSWKSRIMGFYLPVVTSVIELSCCGKRWRAIILMTVRAWSQPESLLLSLLVKYSKILVCCSDFYFSDWFLFHCRHCVIYLLSTLIFL